VAESGADVVVTSNAGCMLQMRSHADAAGHQWPVLHLIELIDASIRNRMPESSA
jgi:Fe-S oxidoreductase